MITYNGSDLILAPLAGFSDVGMRSLCFRYGAGLCFTEMVSAKGLHYNNENTQELLHIGKDEPYTGVQLFGSDPDIIAEAIASERLKNFPVIDINGGCPVPKVVKNGEGSALIEKPELIREIFIKATKAAGGRPVTFKTRKGVTDEALSLDAALAAQEGGASMVTVHGRTRKAMYSGCADLDYIAKIKSALSIPVCGNGDVTDRESYLRMKQTGVDYVMIARGAIGRPYVFAAVKGETPDYKVRELIKEHIGYLSFMADRVVANNMKKQIAFYLKGIPGQKSIKEKVFSATSLEELLFFVDSIQF